MTEYHIPGAKQVHGGTDNYVIQGQPWRDAEGNQYPGGWPLADVHGAIAAPIHDRATQVLERLPRGWTVRAKAAEELAAELAAARRAALAEVDRQAGAARQAFASAGAFQDAEYRLAAEQAEACAAGRTGPFPALQADVDNGTVDPRLGRAVQTVAEAADLVLFTKAFWEGKLVGIRKTRLAAKSAIRSAATPAGVHAAVAAVAWPDRG